MGSEMCIRDSDLPYARPSWARAAEIARTLHQRGVLTKLRQSAGQDVDGGCGQLRARDVQRVQPVKVSMSRLKPSTSTPL